MVLVEENKPNEIISILSGYGLFSKVIITLIINNDCAYFIIYI